MKIVPLTHDWEQALYKISFKFTKDKYGNFNCQTIFTYDTETTNGILLPDGTAIPFEPKRYINDEEYRKIVDENPKVSCVYMWQFAVETTGDVVIFYGRTMDDYVDFITKLKDEVRRQAFNGYWSINRSLETAYAQRQKKYVHLQCYIHNMAFDFQILRNVHEDEFSQHVKGRGRTFARTERRPMKAVAYDERNILEYRCSFVLTQKSLMDWSHDSKLPICKIHVDDDYYLKSRNPYTELTELEIEYGCHDVAAMVYGIQQYRDKYETLENIPLTQTGEIRRALINLCQTKLPHWQLHCYNITKNYSFFFLKFLVDVFAGGYTHGNANLALKVLRNILQYDYTSSYPFVMTTIRMPIGEFVEMPVTDFDDFAAQDVYDTTYRWIAEITFKNVRSKTHNTYWSSSKLVSNPQGLIEDNGRIKSCREMRVRMSDFDFDTFNQMYTYSEREVHKLYVSEADYLPKEIIEFILKYYSYKTSLKGVSGAESMYTESKQFINSVY